MIFRLLRVNLVLILWLIAIPIMAQTSTELRERYGEPQSETYQVRPQIVLSVFYTESGQLCRMEISPRHQKVRLGLAAEVMSSDEVSHIIDELVPIAQRGRSIRKVTDTSGCNEYLITEYEKVIVSLSNRCQAQGAGTYSATIEWKEAKCEK
jgi:hypothetical protein